MLLNDSSELLSEEVVDEGNMDTGPLPEGRSMRGPVVRACNESDSARRGLRTNQPASQASARGVCWLLPLSLPHSHLFPPYYPPIPLPLSRLPGFPSPSFLPFLLSSPSRSPEEQKRRGRPDRSEDSQTKPAQTPWMPRCLPGAQTRPPSLPPGHQNQTIFNDTY